MFTSCDIKNNEIFAQFIHGVLVLPLNPHLKSHVKSTICTNKSTQAKGFASFKQPEASKKRDGERVTTVVINEGVDDQLMVKIQTACWM